jgi:hypothetical protein
MKRTLYSAVNRIACSIRGRIAVRLLIVFAACTLVSTAFFNSAMLFVRWAASGYVKRCESMIRDGYDLSLAMQNGDLGSGDTEKIELLIDSVMSGKSYTVILSDLDGK